MKKLLALAATLLLSVSLAQIQTETDAAQAVLRDTQGIAVECPNPLPGIIYRCSVSETPQQMAALHITAYAEQEGWEPMTDVWDASSGGLGRSYLYLDDNGNPWIASFAIVESAVVIAFYPAQ